MIHPINDAYMEAMDALRAEYFPDDKTEDELTAKEAKDYQEKAIRIAEETLNQQIDPFKPVATKGFS